jgi:amino acid adenylation domain-containing protein
MTDALAQRSSSINASDTSDATITSRFEQQAVALPDELALVTDEVSLTYRTLDLKASRIAAGLAALPCQRERPLVLYMNDEAAHVAAMLGASKAWRIFIPIAPNSPQKWISQVIEDSGAAQIIVDSTTCSVAELAAGKNAAIVDVDKLARSSDSFVGDQSVCPDDTAYIVYTSGSTGRPKGVAISHRSAIHRGSVWYKLSGLGPGERYAKLGSRGVSAGINNTILPLLRGGCLYPLDLYRKGLQELAPWLISQEISLVMFSGSLLRAWLASLPDDIRFPSLRFVGAWAERLYAQDVIRLARHLEGDWRIGHSLSSTESGTAVNQVFTPSRLPEAGIVSAGYPVDRVDVCIKDEAGELVPPGEIGEIIVRSPFLAQGYWNNPDLTAKVFETDPFDNAIRIYHTGDLGRWRSDGTLEHVGRKGRTIKLRGYSVEPFQVECELVREPGVTDAIVMLYEGANSQEPFLVGYVVAPANASPSAMRKGLAERLPSYMVPSFIVVLDSFPIASSGKIDRSALPPPERHSAELEHSYIAPRTPTEEALANIFCDLFNLKQVGIHDNFFELGGHSLLVVQLRLQIQRMLKISISLADIYQGPTIEAIAISLLQQQLAAFGAKETEKLFAELEAIPD